MADADPVASSPTDTRRYFVPLVGVSVALAGLWVRFWIHTVPLGRVNSDEAVTGLMARHLVRGEWTTFYWGQSYAGSLETMVTASIMRVTGSDNFAFHVVPFVESLLVASLVYAIAQPHVGRQRATSAALVIWVFPAAYVLLSTRAMLFYQPTLILGLAAIWLAESIARRQRDHLVAWFAFGLALGLGWWCSLQILFFAIPAFGWLLVHRRDRLVGWLASALGAVIGASPWLIYYFRHDGLPLKQLAGGQGTYVDHLHAIVTAGLPMAVGLRQPITERWLALGLGPLVPALVIIALTAAVVACFRRRVLGHPLTMVAVVFVPLHALAPGSYYIGTGRYYIFLAPTLAFVIAACFRKRAAMAAGLIVAVVVSIITLWDIRSVEVAPDSTGPVVQFLERQRVHHVYAHYWVAYKLVWESHESVIAASDIDRYPQWNAEVRSSAVVAYVMYLPIAQDEYRYHAVTTGLAGRSIAFSEDHVGRYVVIVPEQNVTPEELGLVG
jgi:hypothetical protein